MIGFIRWLRGERVHPDLHALDALHDEAKEQRVEARETRKRAERVGPAMGERVDSNHLTEGFAAAFENTRRRHA